MPDTVLPAEPKSFVLECFFVSLCEMDRPSVDPKVVDNIVDRLKKRGLFDKFRKECLEEIDTKVSCSLLSLTASLSLPLFQLRRYDPPTGTDKVKQCEQDLFEFHKNLLPESVRRN